MISVCTNCKPKEKGEVEEELFSKFKIKKRKNRGRETKEEEKKIWEKERANAVKGDTDTFEGTRSVAEKIEKNNIYLQPTVCCKFPTILQYYKNRKKAS